MYTKHIVLDLEFTQIPKRFKEERSITPYETIQIGAVMLNEHYDLVDSFCTYVKPQFSKHITNRVTDLTGITDADIANAPSFSEALASLVSWIGSGNVRVYSWSKTDLWQITDECMLKGIEYPSCLYRWMDYQR